jgi:hypothetical protein
MLTVSNHQGDTPFDSFIVKGDVTNPLWSPLQTNAKKIMCCIVGGSKLFRFDPSTHEHCFIEFEKSNGKVI